MELYPEDLTKKEMYKLLIGSVVPRPIAWVSTVSRHGENNLAPFSFFNVASRKPPILSISIGPGVQERGGTIKDTLTNIRNTGEFVVNVVTASLADEMHISSKHFPEETDEFVKAGLTPAPGRKVKAPQVKEAPISMECELDRILELGEDHLVLGKLVAFTIEDSYYKNGYIDIEKLRPVGRLAGNYTLVEKIFDLPYNDLEKNDNQQNSKQK
jgi:flavin reductase (DIM6/NTAB) family NADH-FMN oxidoreductase RutF